jgi:transcriptional regulator with XRE-family HTH domain
VSTGKEEQDDFSLGHKMRHARKLRGVTQTEVAKLLNISKDYVSRIEKGERVPSHHIKAAIESWLLVDEGSTGISEQKPTQPDADLLEKVINILDGLEHVLDKREIETEFDIKKGWIRYLYKRLRHLKSSEITREKVEELIVEVEELDKMRKEDI